MTKRVNSFKIQSELRKEEKYKMTSENLKITLEAARINAGFTQKQAAEALDLKASTLAGWEKDSTKLSYLEAHRLAHLYGVNPDILFFGNKNEFIRFIRENKSKN